MNDVTAPHGLLWQMNHWASELLSMWRVCISLIPKNLAVAMDQSAAWAIVAESGYQLLGDRSP